MLYILKLSLSLHHNTKPNTTMSKYYEIKGLKVRVSDHEPNERLRGSSDIYLYTISADGRKLSLRSQVERILESNSELTLSDFNEVLGRKKTTNQLTIAKSYVDLWFQNASENKDLISDLKRNASNLAPSRLNAAQKAKWIAYVEAKINTL